MSAILHGGRQSWVATIFKASHPPPLVASDSEDKDEDEDDGDGDGDDDDASDDDDEDVSSTDEMST